MRAMGWCQTGPAIAPGERQDGVAGSHRRSPAELGANIRGVFAHIVATGPYSVVYIPTHDVIGMYP